jgi:hypothetical protein
MQPLTASNFAVLYEDRADRWLLWFPIIGWMITMARAGRRVKAAKAEVTAQLLQRKEFPSALWQQAGFDAIFVERIASVLRSELDWLPNHYFHPDDPLRLVTLDDWEGIGLLIAEVAVFKSFGVKRLPRRDPETIQRMQTLGDFVKILTTQLQTETTRNGSNR